MKRMFRKKCTEPKKFLPMYDKVCMKAGGYFDEMNNSEKNARSQKNFTNV